MVLVLAMLLLQMWQRRASPGVVLLSASLAHVQLALGDEAGGGGEEQGEGGHGGTAEEVEVERKKKRREHQDY
jgi:hypothetical protein